MGAETERSEGPWAFGGRGLELAREMTALALALPLGWYVALDPDGQLRLLPPSSDALS